MVEELVGRSVGSKLVVELERKEVGGGQTLEGLVCSVEELRCRQFRGFVGCRGIRGLHRSYR